METRCRVCKKVTAEPYSPAMELCSFDCWERYDRETLAVRDEYLGKLKSENLSLRLEVARLKGLRG